MKDASTLDVLLSWKQERAFNCFSETKTSFGFNLKPVFCYIEYGVKVTTLTNRQTDTTESYTITAHGE